jgi:GPH family glycoside/pentoside/hexuronide:cation symporter
MLLYALPVTAVSFSLVLTMAYISKYAIDVLGVPPLAMGLIFGASRVWDALVDPLIGPLTDRTRTRLGRRRPWIAGSALPLAGFGLMLWAAPRALEGAALIAWVTLAIFGFYAAQTAFAVPHLALGAELSGEPHERTRVFALRQAASALGLMLALVLGTGLLSRAAEPRATALWLFLGVGAFLLVAIGLSAARIEERMQRASVRRSRGGSVAGMFRDVWRNPHGRRLAAVYFVEHVGMGANAILAPFLVSYVIGRPRALPVVFAFYTCSILLSVPLWVGIAQRAGKKRAWLVGMGVAVVGYLLLFTVGPGDLPLMYLVVVLTGSASSCGNALGPAVQADVIDWDQHATGERKEGTYYATFTFLSQSAAGVMGVATGFVLDAVGYVPNAEQSESVKLAIRALMSAGPVGCFLAGMAIFARFRLDESEHARIRAELELRVSAPR